jgi:hypothetical protein
MPFGSELMIEIIQSQWFPTSNRIKADADTTHRILEEKIIPLSIIFLTLTAVSTFLPVIDYHWSDTNFGRLSTL